MEAANGDAALTLLGRATPDLVPCDISMPGLDGHEVLEALRGMRTELATTPFVFLTALSAPHESAEGKLFGADDYLVKPVDHDLVLATIAARLRHVERIRTHYDRDLPALQLQNALTGLSGTGAE